METLSVILGLLSFALFGCGLVIFIIAAVKKKPHAARYLWILAAAVVVFVIYMIIVPFDREAYLAEQATATTAREDIEFDLSFDVDEDIQLEEGASATLRVLSEPALLSADEVQLTVRKDGIISVSAGQLQEDGSLLFELTAIGEGRTRLRAEHANGDGKTGYISVRVVEKETEPPTTTEPETTTAPTTHATTVPTTQATTIPTTVRTTVTTTQKQETIQERVLRVANDEFSAEAIEVTFDDNSRIATIVVPYDVILSAEWAVSIDMANMYKVLEALQDDTSFGIQFDIRYPVSDAYGNTSSEEAIDAYFSPETRQQINWDGFTSDNLPIIADSFNALAELYAYIF